MRSPENQSAVQSPRENDGKWTILWIVSIGLFMANSPALTTMAFPASERGRAMGIIGAVVAIGTSAGPTLGGIITDHLSWRWIFYINVPIGIIGIAATLHFMPQSRRIGERQRFDPIGAILFCACITCLMPAMSFGQEFGWGSPGIMGLFGAALFLLPAFILHERRTAQPILDLSVFQNRLFSAALLSSFLSFLALFAIMFLIPFYLQELMAMPVKKAGMVMTAVPLTISVVAPLSGWLSDRFGSRVRSSVGPAIGSAALWFLGNLSHNSSLFDIIWPLVMAGLGQGLFQSPNNNAIMGAVSVDRLGIASSFMATVRVLGQGFSVALAGTLFTSLVRGGRTDPLTAAEAEK
ncbi:MAG: MFS transporter [Syntrophobacteraceae bacterium]